MGYYVRALPWKKSDPIQKTFQNRKTELQKIEPAQEDMIGLWSSFQRKVPVAPKDISEAINGINDYLKEIQVV